MEKYIQLQTNDNHIIYGTHNFYENKKSKLIIFVHGLSGNQYEHHYYNAVPYFCSKGFDTFRFDLYCGRKNARQLSECNISIHSQDLKTVIDNFKNQYKELYLVGHSIGSLVIMNTDTSSISKIIQWDPTYGLNSLEEKKITYDEKSGLYIFHRGIEFTINKILLEERKEAYNKENYVKRIQKNTSFIFAGDAKSYELWKSYIKNYKTSVIKGASHVFIEEGTEKQLFDETLKSLEN